MGAVNKVPWLARRVWDTRPCDSDSSSSYVGKVPSMPWASVSQSKLEVAGQVWESVPIKPTLGR